MKENFLLLSIIIVLILIVVNFYISFTKTTFPTNKKLITKTTTSQETSTVTTTIMTTPATTILLHNITTTTTVTFTTTTTLPEGCEYQNYRMAFILVENSNNPHNQEDVNKINIMKQRTSQAFAWATNNLASMDTSYPLIILSLGENPSEENITKEFYKGNPDNFHFITIFNTYENSTIQKHNIIKNNITGIGIGIFDSTKRYGSNEILLGINWMGIIDNYDLDNEFDIDVAMSGILHETGHQWCCYVGDNFARGENDAKLEIIQQNIHFYRGLESPYETGTPMNADYWVNNNDGTYRRENKIGIERYHPFELYFMGLLPEAEYDTKFQIYDAGIPGANMNFTNAVPYKQVSVNDIIKVEGKRICK